MSASATITAEIRERAGKGAARATRRAGRVPAVVYGNKKDPEMVSLNPIELHKLLHKPGFFSTVFDLDLSGKKQRVLARDLQLHPVTDFPLHVDFMRVSADMKVSVMIPVHFINEEDSPGIKRGGVLNIVRHEIEIESSPDNIPAEITIDLTGLEIGDGIHISNVSLPDGVEPTITDRDFTIATVAAPSSVKSEASEEGEEEGGEEGGEE
ncbi:MAG: 50S ribosomal protein L25/general stress protein Ctc, partial [Rhodospirillales bacterium]|nr:50S ribosomal protein L25/general stress protein Ctc [Rhodospirillales bacterium]